MDQLPPDKARELHYEYLLKAHLEGGGQFDKLVTWLTAAALGGSFTLLKDVPRTQIYGRWGWFVLAAWVSLALSLAAGVWSIRVSQEDLRREVERLVGAKNDEDLSGRVEFLNWVMLGGLGLGVLFFGVFAFKCYLSPHL